MEPSAFEKLAEALTGTPVKGLVDSEREILRRVLEDDEKALGHSQLNELLLLVNKDRMERPFYDYFFGDGCTVGSIEQGVRKFQRMAMLSFGNFVYAYRKLSRAATHASLLDHLGDWRRTTPECEDAFRTRHEKLVRTEPIARDDTWLVGYISAKQIVADQERAQLLLKLAETTQSWDAFIDAVGTVPVAERSVVQAPLAKAKQGSSYPAFVERLRSELGSLSEAVARLTSVRASATRNQDVYLTWDHMDIYFATSMRTRSEYEDLFDFVEKLMNEPLLEHLKLRHFDPTQAYTQNRIDKGLVESLMLKRARLTVYSVQDTDTLGKDSDLAATLAQGKPVVAFVPRIDIQRRCSDLGAKPLAALLERVRFVLFADDALPHAEQTALQNFRHTLESFQADQLWRSLPNGEAERSFVASSQQAHQDACASVARAEARIYDKRASTLKDTHPLGIQVNLATGVANGVLVVRSEQDCAKVVRGILTNSLELSVEPGSDMWCMREATSGCVFRVVSKNIKLTNCFWNFYRQS